MSALQRHNNAAYFTNLFLIRRVNDERIMHVLDLKRRKLPIDAMFVPPVAHWRRYYVRYLAVFAYK